MNHQKIYESIIQKAKFENRIKLRKNQENYIYYENHHIIPKCLGGSDEEKNKVLLTAREHFVCHKLLTYIFKGNRKIASAFHRMTYNNRGKLILMSRDYVYAKELLLIPRSEETRKKISDSHKGKKRKPFTVKTINKMKEAAKNRPLVSLETKEKQKFSHMGLKQSKETIEKRISKIKGLKRSEKTKRKLSESHLGKKYKPLTNEHKEKLRKANMGKKRSLETRIKNSKAAKGHIVTIETIQKMIETRKKNKNKLKNELDCTKTHRFIKN